MNDKPLFEFRLVKTDDGIRFEMNADKEHLRELKEYRLRRQALRQEWKAWAKSERRYWKHALRFGSWWDYEPEPAEKPADQAAPTAPTSDSTTNA